MRNIINHVASDLLKTKQSRIIDFLYQEVSYTQPAISSSCFRDLPIAIFIGKINQLEGSQIVSENCPRGCCVVRVSVDAQVNRGFKTLYLRVGGEDSTARI
jgi:hypothetical protein